MSDTEQAVRLADTARSDLPDDLDDTRVCYWKDSVGEWWIYLPRAGVGHLVKHIVTEHDDRTITVRPSILLSQPTRQNPDRSRHGFLTRGEWKEV